MAADRLDDEAAASRAFDELVEALRAKYGREVSYSVRRDRLGRSGSVRWASGRTTVTASLFIGGSIFVFYGSSLSTMGDKL